MVCNNCAARVAENFVRQYYFILRRCPENLYKFYKEPSLLGRPGANGVLEHVTTIRDIHEKMMVPEYKYGSVEVKMTDAQITINRAMIVIVSGCLVGNDDVQRNFSQTFILARQERGYYVLNDILKILNKCETTTTVGSADELGQPAGTEMNIENRKEEDDIIVGANDVVGIAASVAPKPKRRSEEAKVGSDDKAACNSIVKDDSSSMVAPTTKPDVVVEETSTKEELVVAPTNDLSTITPNANATNKFSYAYVLAKEDSVIGSNVTSSSSKVAPKSPTTAQRPLNVSPCVEAKGIYIGGLPYNITEQEVVDAVKIFGPVRRNSDITKIMRHEDGFCFGFVEFESADAANRALEAHHVMFGETKAYISYKRLSSSRGGDNSGGTRSVTRGRNQNANIM